MKQFDPKLIRERIRDVVLREMDRTESVAADIAFHITDWLENLEAYNSFCANLEGFSDVEVNPMLIQFLVHVPNPLAAAC